MGRLTPILAATLLCATSVATAAPASEPYRGQVIDVHLHAFSASFYGPPPVAICVGESVELDYDASRPWPQELAKLIKTPRCSNPFLSPTTDESLRDQTLAEMRRLNVVGVISGPPERVKDYQDHAPDRVIPAIEFDFARFHYTPEQIETLFAKYKFKVFGEITDQYEGVGVDDPRFDPFWDFCVAHDLPVAIHMGIGPPGGAAANPGFRASLHSPFVLERLLQKHPQLRVYAMHAAWPMIDELKTMLYEYPQLYVDTGTLQAALPRAEYYRFLRDIVDAGFGDRIMYGTDQIVWPGLIQEGITAINAASFLTTAQKQAILHDNATRFLRIKSDMPPVQ